MGRLACFAVLFPACEPGPIANERVPLEDFFALEDRVLCENDVSCGFAEDIEECLAIYAFPDYPDTRAAVRSGRMDYDGAAAAICFEELAARSCDGRERVDVAACEDVFTGNVRRGGDCFLGAECRPALDCDFSDCGSETCCAGRCEPRLREGSLCDLGGIECVRGTECNDFEGTCEPPAGVGAPCVFDESCEEGLVCSIAWTSFEWACWRPSGHGEPCDPDQFDACALWTDACDAVTTTCVSRSAVGETCDDAGWDPCVYYARCDFGACTRWGEPGAPCYDSLDCRGFQDCVAGQCALEPLDPCAPG